MLSTNPPQAEERFRRVGADCRPYFVVAICLGVLALGYLVAYRTIAFGSDAYNYASLYHGSIWTSRVEIGYKVLMWSGRELGLSVNLFFWALFIILNASLAVLAGLLCSYNFNYISRPLAIAGMLSALLTSSWYIVATTNGLRQGLALPYIYISGYLFIQRRWLLSGLSMVIACSFHQSAMASAALFPALLLRPRALWAAYALLLFGYMLGLNERLVALASAWSGLDVYGTVANYQDGEEKNYFGFNYIFVSYTVGSLIVIYSVVNSSLVDARSRRALRSLQNLLMVLSMSYFVFGFAAYANRFGYVAWFFIPICLAFCALSLNTSIGFRYVLVVSTFLVGLVNFISEVYK